MEFSELPEEVRQQFITIIFVGSVIIETPIPVFHREVKEEPERRQF